MFRSSKIWEGQRIIESHPWLKENWTKGSPSKQNGSCPVKVEPLPESSMLLLTVAKFSLIIFPSRICQTQPSPPGRAETLICEGWCLPSFLTFCLLTLASTVFWNVDSVRFGHARLTLFREATASKAFGKIHVNILHYGVTVRGLPRMGLFPVSLPQRK